MGPGIPRLFSWPTRRFEPGPFMRFTGNGAVERESITRRRKWLKIEFDLTLAAAEQRIARMLDGTGTVGTEHSAGKCAPSHAIEDLL
jgi:hypothetical protein